MTSLLVKTLPSGAEAPVLVLTILYGCTFWGAELLEYVFLTPELVYILYQYS